VVAYALFVVAWIVNAQRRRVARGTRQAAALPDLLVDALSYGP
jgi:hypothetical protein